MKARYRWTHLLISIVSLLLVQTSLAETADERFSHARHLTKQDKSSESIQAYEALIQDFPELSEPYNNLAVLYAEQGDYEAASKTLLRALNNHRTCGKLFNNLKAVHTKIASSAYSRALGTAENNGPLQLVVIETINGLPLTVAENTVQPEVVATEAMTSPGKSVSDTHVESAAVIAVLEAWAAAWSAQDVEHYLASYSDHFQPSGGVSLQAWKKQRKQRLEKPSLIQVSLHIIGTRIDNKVARVSLRQSYRSDNYSDSVAKRFILNNGEKGWKIVREEVTGP